MADDPREHDDYLAALALLEAADAEEPVDTRGQVNRQRRALLGVAVVAVVLAVFGVGLAMTLRAGDTSEGATGSAEWTRALVVLEEVRGGVSDLPVRMPGYEQQRWVEVRPNGAGFDVAVFDGEDVEQWMVTDGGAHRR